MFNWYRVFCWFGLHDSHGEVIDGMAFIRCIHCNKLEPMGECED